MDSEAPEQANQNPDDEMDIAEQEQPYQSSDDEDDELDIDEKHVQEAEKALEQGEMLEEFKLDSTDLTQWQSNRILPRLPKSLRKLEFCSIDFPNEDDLFSTLKKLENLESFTLIEHSFTPEIIKSLLTSISGHLKLQLIDLSNNNLAEGVHIDALCENLKSTSASKLILQSNGINGADLQNLCMRLPDNITHLNLWGNHIINANSFQSNLDILKSHLNPTVSSLCIGENKLIISDKLTQLIVQFLKEKRTITNLDFKSIHEYYGYVPPEISDENMSLINEQLYLNKKELYLSEHQYSLRAQSALVVAKSKEYRLDGLHSIATKPTDDANASVYFVREYLNIKEPYTTEYGKILANAKPKTWLDNYVAKNNPPDELRQNVQINEPSQLEIVNKHKNQGVKRPSETYVGDLEGQSATKQTRHQ
jgi:hypothetical protein